MSKKYAFLLMGKDFNPQRDHACFSAGGVDSYIITVRSPEEAVKKARELADEGFGALEVCGAFGENLVVSGFDFKTMPIGTKFQCNDVVLELTQVGKQCHAHCEIYKVMGDCIMPREGVFTRVLHGGTISVGDTLTVLEE